MMIPNFQSEEQWNFYEATFKNRWDAKKTFLDCVKDDLFPETNWTHLPPKTIEVIYDIVQRMLYETNCDFEKQYSEYKKDQDDLFVSRKSLKEIVTEAISDFMINKFETIIEENPTP